MVRFDPLGRFLRRTSTLAHDEFEPGDDKIEGNIPQLMPKKTDTAYKGEGREAAFL